MKICWLYGTKERNNNNGRESFHKTSIVKSKIKKTKEATWKKQKPLVKNQMLMKIVVYRIMSRKTMISRGKRLNMTKMMISLSH